MRVALIQCPVWGTREPPLSIVQLSACLKAGGHEVHSVDLNNRLYRDRTENLKTLWAWEQSLFWYDRNSVRKFFTEHSAAIGSLARDVLSKDPSVVCFSLAASSYHSSVEFAVILRKLAPSIKIVFGGQLFCDGSYIEKAFNESPVDFIVQGEGDSTVPELASTIESGGDLSKCPGIFIRENGAIACTGPRKPLEDLNSLPYMDFSDLRLEDYDDCRHILMMSSRGCVWNCAFCSSRSFWEGYRYMSAERMHQEIVFHKLNQSKDMSHVDFADLALNGNMERVKEFCELMLKYPPYPSNCKMQWISNAIIHPGLTKDVLSLMARAGCQRLIFGIESGSKNVLKHMKKMYNPEIALRVIKDAHSAGIKVTCNFMFGFPGETEEDFNETLKFLECIAPYVERVYPSRTYCAIEEFSYLHKHPEEFGIKTPFSHHLYWESTDGKNTYPVRLGRCQKFEELCDKLGVQVDCGVKTSVQLDEWFNLGHYYDFRKEYKNALKYFIKYSEFNAENEIVSNKIKDLTEKMTLNGPDPGV